MDGGSTAAGHKLPIELPIELHLKAHYGVALWLDGFTFTDEVLFLDVYVVEMLRRTMLSEGSVFV